MHRLVEATKQVWRPVPVKKKREVRVFAPGAGIDEDPVTGSAHAVMVPYWAKRLGRDTFTAYQASARGGRLTCRLEPAPAESDRVVLGGGCVTVMEGSFLL